MGSSYTAWSTDEVDGVRVEWTAELRDTVLPFRGDGEAVHPKAVKPETIFRGVLTAEGVALLAQDLGIEQRLEEEARAACLLAVRGKRVEFVVDRWVMNHGWAQAIAQITKLAKLSLVEPCVHGTSLYVDVLERMRRLLAHAEGYAEALAWAQASLRDWGDPTSHMIVASTYAFLFPDHHPFFEAALSANGIPHGNASSPKLPKLLLASVKSEEDLTAIVAAMLQSRGRWWWGGEYGVSLARTFGARGFGLLEANVSRKTEEPYLVALTPYAGEAPAKAIATFIGNRSVSKIVQAYFTIHPDLARSVVTPLTTTGKKVTRERAGLILKQIESDERPPVTASVAATASDLPSVLASPPWRKKNRGRILEEKKILHADVPIVCPEKTGGVRENSTVRKHPDSYDVDLTSPPGTYAYKTQVDRRWQLDTDDSLAVFGAAALPSLYAVVPSCLKNGYRRSVDPLAAVGDIAFVPLVAKMLSLDDWKDFAHDWTARFPEHTVAGLMPLLFGKDGDERDDAVGLLRWLIANGKTDLVLGAAERAGVRDDLQAWLARDPLDDAPKKVGKLPKFLELAKIPRPELAAGGALDDTATIALIEMLQFSGTSPVYAGIAQVKAAVTPTSLDRFATAIVEAWILAGSKGANGWLADAIGLLGSPDVVGWIEDRMKGLAAQKEKAAALRMVQALLRIDSPAARMRVLRQVDHGNQRWLKEGASDLLAKHLAEQRLSMDTYEEGAVPPMPAFLDFGEDRCTISLDRELAPCLRGPDGQRLNRVPATKGAAADSARAEWARLRDDAELIVKMQRARFERLVMSGESIAATAFASVLAHPILRGLAERLVFVSDARDGTTSFRVSEDGSLASHEDETFALSEGTSVRLAHPIDMSTALLASWRGRFTDYELIQPFDQLGRQIFVLTEEERTASTVDRWKGAKAYRGSILAMRLRGWRLMVEIDAISGATKSVRTRDGADAAAYVSFTPNVDISDASKSEHELDSLRLDGARFGDLTEKTASELCSSVALLATR